MRADALRHCYERWGASLCGAGWVDPLAPSSVAVRDNGRCVALVWHGQARELVRTSCIPVTHACTIQQGLGVAVAPSRLHAVCTCADERGLCRFLKVKNPDVQIVGLQPASESSIPGIRRWPPAYLPTIFDASRVDRVMDITQREAEECMRALARVEGIMAGVSSGGAVSAALRLASEVCRCTPSTSTKPCCSPGPKSGPNGYIEQ